MIKKILFIVLILIINSNCSFDTKSGIWTKDQKIIKSDTKENKVTVLFEEKKLDNKEFNVKLIVQTPLIENTDKFSLSTNNFGAQKIVDNFSKKSKYKFSKIKYFDYFEPVLVFDKNDLIFFDKLGTIIRFDDTSRIKWKKNYYSKTEKKSLPVLNFSSNGKLLVITDNLANYYVLNIKSGELLWKKSHPSVFISEIKIDEDRFYIMDSDNNLNCFSIINGEKIWEFKTDENLIKSQKRLSIVFDDSKVYFNNSIGEIYSLNKDNGNLIWVIPTRDEIESFKSFLLKTSDLVLDNDILFLSNNKGDFYSIDINTGIINWTQNINSEIKPIVAGNIIFSISNDGYLFVIDKTTGSIIRATNIYRGIKSRILKKLKISGFVVGLNKIYISLNNGKILQIDIKSGKILSILKISKGKISEPIINDGKMFIVKNNEIIKLN